MKLKRLLAVLLVGVFAFAMVGCGQSEEEKAAEELADALEDLAEDLE